MAKPKTTKANGEKPKATRGKAKAPLAPAPATSKRGPAAPSSQDQRSARPSALLDTRVIYCGDNLEQLKKLPKQSVDLIYIDPPFNSNRNYEVFWGENKEKRSFDDRHASTQAYIDYMRPRCVALSKVLRPTGSFYYHCDDHASHYVKVMLDQIFGHNNFRNEIVWKRTGARSDAQKWNQLHDTIFFYSGGDEYTWNPQFAPHSEEYLETKYVYTEPDGRRYRLDNMTSPNPRPNMMYEWKGHASPEKGWRYSKETMAQLDAENRVQYPDSKAKRPQLKRYLDEQHGVALGSVWTDIPPVNSQAAERLGYPTQKPLQLLDRVISASSKPNDVVLDAFCGCGTTLVSAQNLGRQWIGIDISPTACRVMAKRLRDVCKIPESKDIWRKDNRKAFIVKELPYSQKQLHAMPAFEFENWAVIGLGGIPNKIQVGDMGIDGRIFPVGTKPSDANNMFAGDWFPVQVKQTDKAGRPDIDAFEAVMHREDRQRGFFVAFGYTSDAHSEVAAFHKKSGRLIKLITVQEILDGDHVQKM